MTPELVGGESGTLSWAWPQIRLLLWLLLPLALGAWLSLRARRQALARLGSLVDSLSSEGAARLPAIRLTLLLLALGFGVLALAGPRWGFRWEELEREGLTVAVVLDVSSSMAAQDVSPSRMERARRKVVDLADVLEGDRVGLVVFAGGAYPRMPLTLDYDALQQMAKDSDTETLAAQGSDLGAAIDAAIALLDDGQKGADKAIILISDGEDQVGDGVAAAARALEAGAHVYAIGVGTAEGAPIPLPEGGFKKDAGGQVVLTRLEEDTLKEVAQAGAGAYVRASAGAGDLRRLYEDEIRGKLETASQGVLREKIWDERYQWPLAAALVCGLLAAALRPGPLRIRGGAALSLLLLTLGWPALPAHAAPEASAKIEGLQAAHRQDPDDLALAERLGWELYQAGDYDQASALLEEVADRTRDAAQEARARYNAGLADYRDGRLTDALEAWQEVLGEAPDHAAAKQNAAAVQKEIAARMQKKQEDQQQDPQDGQQQDQEQDQQPPKDQQQPQDQQDQQDQQDAQAQQDQQDPEQPQNPTPESDGTREEREPDSGQQGQEQQADAQGEPDTGEAEDGEPSDQPKPGSISAQEADKMLEGVEEGEPRVVVKPNSRGGKDW